MAEAVEQLGPMTEISLDGEAKSRAQYLLRMAWRGGIAILLLLVLALALLVAFGNLYRPGDDVGYNLGLVGGIMMLTLLLYPLRKRIRAFEHFGPMKQWFRYHMVIGIAGPVLILFHSTFHTGSMNGRVALYATLLVAASGIVGRFVYRHVHRGLYGRKMTLAEAQQEFRSSSNDMRSVLAVVPQIAGTLEEFHSYAARDLPGIGARMWRFLTLRLRSRRVANAAYVLAKKALKQAAKEHHWSRIELRLHWKLAKSQIRAYLGAVCSVAQFATWERMFALWHVVHVPFIYLLVICGIVHVVAVHMY